jgi:DNA-binding response OmpR family regulator
MGMKSSSGLTSLHVLQRLTLSGSTSGLSMRTPTAIGVRSATTNAHAKPFAYAEVHGQIRALLRRAAGRERTARMRVGALEVDPASRTAWLCGRPVRLTQTEFALLRVLASSPTTVRTKPELIKAVWGYQGRTSSRTLDSHICRLRSKLRTPNATFIRNSWGIGYRLVDDPVVQPDAEALAAVAPRRLTAR